MRKYLAKKSLKTIDKLLLFSKKKVSYSGNIDRRANNSNKPADRTDENLNDRIDKFEEVINGEKNYRIPWRYFCDLGKKTIQSK